MFFGGTIYFKHLRTMDCPECEELKVAYTSCLKGYVNNRLYQWDFKTSGPGTTDINQCEEPFQVGICMFGVQEIVLKANGINCVASVRTIKLALRPLCG